MRLGIAHMLLRNPRYLAYQVRVRGRSPKQIALELGVTLSVVRFWLRRYGIN